MIMKLKSAIVVAMVSAGSACAQVADFNTSNNVLSLSTVIVGGRYYGGLNVLLPANGAPWQLMGSPLATSPLGATEPAVYDDPTAILRIPLTQIGATTYSDIMLSLPIGGAWAVLSGGNVYATYSNGYEVEFPIRSKVKNSFNDSGGEHTYQLTNGQYWKHVADEPCMPAAAAADPEGYSDVEIFPNPGFSGSNGVSEGNFRFVGYYPSKANAIAVETCLVVPISGVYPAGGGGSSLNAMAASPADVTGGINEERNIFISGGTPPYLVRTSNPGIANFNFLPQSASASGQSLRVQLLRPGTATLSVFDYNRQAVSVPVTVSPESTTFFVSPVSTEVKAETKDMQKFSGWVFGGTPPYRIVQNGAPQSMTVSTPDSLGYFTYQAKCPSRNYTGEVKFYVIFGDAKGRQATMQYEIDFGENACSVSGTGPGVLG